MAHLSQSNLLSSTFYCLVCNKNTNNLYFNIDTTFLSKSKNVSVHTKIVQIVGNYNFNDRLCITKVLCMICFKILETVDVLECELTKQKIKFKSQFRKSVEARRNEADQQPIHSNQIRSSNIDRNTLYAFNNVDDIIESVNKRSGGSSEQVNDILSSFLSTSDGNSQDSSDLASEQFISSLRTTDSPSRIHFIQNECRDDLAQPIIEKLFADDSGLNVIHDNEDTVNTITITESQTDNEISIETRIESKLREILDSKESNKSKNNQTLEIIPGDALRKEHKSEREKSFEVKNTTKRKEDNDLSGTFSHPEGESDDQEDTDNMGSLSNDTLDYHGSDFKNTEKSNAVNISTKIDVKKRKIKQDDEIFSKTIKLEDDWDLYTSSNSPTQKSLTDNPFFCDLCDERFSTSIKLAKHREDVHSHILCHVCSDCGARYREKAKLTRHLQSQHKVNPHQCQGCDFKAKSQNGLDKHILDTHPESKYFECDICNKKFSTHRYLNVVHMKRCHYGLPIKYRCNICNKGFVDKTAIENHRLTHSTIKDHTCEFCGASFRTPYSLKVHTNIHTKEIKYPCGDCGANFLRNANLIAHKNRYHNSGDGKLVCENCGNSFLTKRDLQRHQDAVHPNIKDKPLTCDICQKSFYSKEKLKNHLRSHTVGPKYQCPICSHVFARKVLLQRHLTSTHYAKTKINDSKQNLIVNKNNIEEDSVNKKIHVKNISPTEENSVEKENVVIIVNNSEVNPLSLFNIDDHQIFGKPHNSHTLIPHTFESPQNVKDITRISGNQIETLTGTRISLPSPIILNTIKDPLQLNNEEEITSENETINYQEYIHGVTLQSAACISLDSENLEETNENNFSNELLSSSQILVPESGFALLTGDVSAVEKQAASLILASKDIQNYSKQAAVLLLNQDDLDSEKSLLLASKDIHNYSKQTPILKLDADVVSESTSGPFTAIMLTDQEINSESRDSSALTLVKDINPSNELSPSTLTLANEGISNSSRQTDHHFTKLSISKKNISKNGSSESLSALSLPSEIVDSDSVERTLPLTLVTEDVEEKTNVKEHNISFSFSAVEEGAKEQNLVTEWF